MSKNMRVNLIANTSQFKSAMSESSNQIKLLNSEFKNAAAETDQYGNKLDSTSAKKKQLSGVIDQYKNRIKTITNEQKHWNSELEKGNITEEQHSQKQEELARRLNNTEGEMKRYEGQLKRLNAEGKNTTKTYAEFDRQFRDIGKTMRNVGAQVGITAGIGFMAMKKVLGDVVGEAKEFHAQMSEVKAISGATGAEMEELTNQSKELGRQTKYTAQEVAESQANLARAGFESNEILESMPGLLDLAASSNLELGNAADITSNIIRTFNKEAEESGEIADVLAKGAATANTDVQGLGKAFETAGPVANSLDVSIESLAASTGLMADAGISGEKSGRMLRQGMLRLSKPTGEAGDLLKDMGVNAFDADGNMKSLDKVVGELEKGMKGYDKQQRAAALSTIFGSESTAGWTVLLDEGEDALKDYTKELENSEGAAKDMADTMQDNAEGAIIRMESALSGLKIELGEKLLPVIGEAADWIGDLANGLSEMDEATVETIAKSALLVTGILGVTTAVATLVTGVGALMAFAGPVGLAIVGGTALLSGFAAMLYNSSNKTKKLKEEQEKAHNEAIRYGDGLSEGTRKGVQGYTDLYEGAKLKMHELKSMSGEEAEKTVKEIQKAFGEMSDTVIAELEVQRDKLTKAIDEIYQVAGEHGKENAEELTDAVLEAFDKDIAAYKQASETISEIIEEHGSNVQEYPDKVKEAYDEAWGVMDQGAQEFARSQKEMQTIQKNISEREGKIMADEAEGYLKRINKTYEDAHKATNDWYVDKTDIIDQALAQDRISAEDHEELMTGIEASTQQMYDEAGRERSRTLMDLQEHLDERGRLLDLSTGKELEREEVRDETLASSRAMRLETDEEYLDRWIKHNEDVIKDTEGFSDDARRVYSERLVQFLEGLDMTHEEAIETAKDLVSDQQKELEKGNPEARKSGKDRGESHNHGLADTEQSILNTSSNIVDGSLYELGKGDVDAKTSGGNRGESHSDGLQSTYGLNERTAELLSGNVANVLGKTTDGGGGASAGRGLSSGISSQKGSVIASAKSVSTSARNALSSVGTYSVGTDFVSGFRNSISARSGLGSSLWNTAYSMGSNALGALRSSINSASPSKETGKLGVDFGDGFNLAIGDSTKEAIVKAKEMGKGSVRALSDEVNHYKQQFGTLAFALEDNKQSLKVEHALDGKFEQLTSMFDALNNNDDKATQKELLNATLQQNQILMQLLAKESTAIISKNDITDAVNEKNALDQLVNIF